MEQLKCSFIFGCGRLPAMAVSQRLDEQKRHYRRCERQHAGSHEQVEEERYFHVAGDEKGKLVGIVRIETSNGPLHPMPTHWKCMNSFF